ncbi:MAG: hypothetical protein RIB59_17625 [Rhodospirillales bacterium]
MAEKNVTKPSPLSESWELLGEAVSRLEAAQQTLAEKTASNGAASAAVKTLQEENKTLREVNEAVSERLDGVIHRLKSVLEV